MVTSHYGCCVEGLEIHPPHCNGNIAHWWITPSSSPGTVFSWRAALLQTTPPWEMLVFRDSLPWGSPAFIISSTVPPVASLLQLCCSSTSLHPSLVPYFPSRYPSRSIFPNTPPAYKFTPHSLFPGYSTETFLQSLFPSIIVATSPSLQSSGHSSCWYSLQWSISSPSKDKSLAIWTPGPLPLWPHLLCPQYWLPGCFSNILGTLLPHRPLHILFCHPEYSLPAIYIASSFKYFKSWLKGDLNKDFPDPLPKCAGTLPTPRAQSPIPVLVLSIPCLYQHPTHSIYFPLMLISVSSIRARAMEARIFFCSHFSVSPEPRVEMCHCSCSINIYCIIWCINVGL